MATYGELDVIPPILLVQEWYDQNLKKPTLVRLELSQNEDQTILHLVHSQVPDDRYDDLSDGWKDYYLGPLKEIVEK